jgi:hypothetical protein
MFRYHMSGEVKSFLPLELVLSKFSLIAFWSLSRFSYVLLFCRDADLSLSCRKTVPYPSPRAVNFPKGFLHFWSNSTWWNEVWTLLWETRSFQPIARNSKICGYNIRVSSGNWAWCSACSQVTVRSRVLRSCQWLSKPVISHLLRSPNIYGLLHTRLTVYAVTSQITSKIHISLRFISNHLPIYASPKSTCCFLPYGFSYWNVVFVSSLYHAPRISVILVLWNFVTQQVPKLLHDDSLFKSFINCMPLSLIQNMCWFERI